MGRRRTKNLDLPPRLYLRGSTYYYVAADKHWHRLGTDRSRALRLWAELECVPTAVTVGELIRQFLAEGVDGLAATTRRRYADYARTVEDEFGALPLDDLTRFGLARWRDSGRVARGWFNGCLSVLRKAYRRGGEWGWTRSDEPDHVAFNRMGRRRRDITDAEFRAIRDRAPTWLQTAMDISYLTSLREGDVLSLRWSAIAGRLCVEQEKTGTRQAFEITAPLRAVLEGAKRVSVVGLFVVSTDKGRPISPRRLQEAFARARDAAKVDRDTRFHDIRGKSATDAADEGMDYQAMLGHTTKAMSDRYIKRIRTIKAPSHKRRV